MISFHEWEAQQNRLQRQDSSPDDADVKILEIEVVNNKDNQNVEATTTTDEAAGGGEPESRTIDPRIVEKMSKLCRVCTSSGLTNIDSSLSPNDIRSRKMRVYDGDEAWQVPIYQMLTHISGEDVRPGDNLPQFICSHCLDYLLHAYQMRLQIRASAADMQIVLEHSDPEALTLEEKIDPGRETRREIQEIEDELAEQNHFDETFKGAKININSRPPLKKWVEGSQEFKCETCFKRIMSKDGLAAHKSVCGQRIIEKLVENLHNLHQLRSKNKLTTKEHLMYVIRLVFDTKSDLQRVATADGIDVSSISSDLPKLTTQPSLSNNFYTIDRRNPCSPDNGYASGGKF